MMRLHLLLTALLFSVLTKADNSITEYDKQFFIDNYVTLAIEEMDFSGIPASITLAQAILESGWGRGSVAEGANNYFCIKCNNGWEGETFDAKDDEPGLSCFRKYQTVFESFRDHSLFLKDGRRYQPLFDLERTDFQSWAEGLKKCGYATDDAYADKLIDLIEEHGLWIFDYAMTAQQFKVIDTPVIPDVLNPEPGETIFDHTPPDVKPMQDIAGSFLALPSYRYEENVTEVTEPARFLEEPMQPEGIRRTRIRPITPHPVIPLDRAD